MKDRLQKFIDSQNLSAARFADEIGVQRSAVSHILSDRNKPGFDFIHKILSRFKQLNAEWLIMGTGSMLKDIHQASLFPDITTEVRSVPPAQSRSEKAPEHPEESLAGDENPPQYGVNKAAVPVKKVEKIIFFYTDKTFSQFHPE